MYELKATAAGTIPIPAKVMKKLALHDGTIVEGVVEDGKLFILQRKDKTAAIMQFAGIWENENVDEIFTEIRKGWEKWRKTSLA